MEKNNTLKILLPVLLLLQLWFTYITFNYPFLGINLIHTTQNAWQIQSFETKAPHLLLNLKIGDTILKINDRNPKNFSTVKNFRTVEQADNLTISRDGQPFIITITKNIGKLSAYFYNLFGEAISFCIALLMYLNSSHSKSAKFLSFLFLMVGLVFMSLEASPRGDVFAKLLVDSIVMALPFIFLHFLIIFFREKGNIALPHKFLYFFYGLIGLIELPSVLYFTPLTAYPYYKFTYNVILLFFLLGSLLVFAFLVFIYLRFRKESPPLLTIIKTIWFAFIASFLPLALLSFLPELIYKKDIVNSNITAVFTLFFPLTFCYLLISKKLFDIDLIMRRVLSTTIVSLVPSIMIMVALILIFQSDFTLQRGIFSFIFIISIISFLLYSLEHFTTKLEAIMFPHKHYLQTALKRISNDLESIKSFRELKEIILLNIINTLQVAGGAIVFQYHEDLEIIDDGAIELNKIKAALQVSLSAESAYSVYEINQHEEYTSYLVLTSKKTNTFFSKEESQWLKVVLSNLAISLENLYLIRKLNLKLHELASQLPNEQGGNSLKWFRKTMFDMQEKERIRIAADLHDSMMQDIFFIQRKLKTFQKQSILVGDAKQLSDIIYHLDTVNINLRQCCFELNPPILETVGLLKTIENLVDIESKLISFELAFITDWNPLIEQRDPETKRHLFRIVQELLNNAKKHSQASHVTVSCTCNDGHFYLEYQDDGIGFDIGNIMVRKQSGIGIEQMKSRIHSIMGVFEMQSSRGKGLQVQITIPIAEGEMTA